MSDMRRRQFMRLLAATPMTYLSLRLVGCGPAPAAGSVVASGETVEMYDLIMRGFSTLGSGFLGNTGVLQASVIAANQTTELRYIQDPHGHEFTLTPEHFGKLRRGETIDVLTTEALGHRHRVVIDPNRHAPGSQPLTMPVDPDAVDPSPDPDNNEPDPDGDNNDQPQEQLFAALGDAEDPVLVIAGSENIASNSVEFCLDEAVACANDAELWQAIALHSEQSGVKFFAEDGARLSLSALSVDEHPLQLRAKTISGDELVKTITKLMRK